MFKKRKLAGGVGKNVLKVIRQRRNMVVDATHECQSKPQPTYIYKQKMKAAHKKHKAEPIWCS